MSSQLHRRAGHRAGNPVVRQAHPADRQQADRQVHQAGRITSESQTQHQADSLPLAFLTGQRDIGPGAWTALAGAPRLIPTGAEPQHPTNHI